MSLQTKCRCVLGAAGGNVAIELAFLAPVLLVLLLAAVEYGRVINDKMQLASAARTGVQFALQTNFNSQDLDSLGAQPCDAAGLAAIQQVVCDATGLDDSEITVTPTRDCECASGVTVTPLALCTDSCTGGAQKRVYVKVTVQEQFRTLVPVSVPGFGEIIPNPFTISEEATMRVQ